MKKFKKIISMCMVTVMAMSIMCVGASAESNISIGNIGDRDNRIEITESDIIEKGIKTVDEYGNEVIEIPIQIDTNNVDLPAEPTVEPYHFHIAPHSHYIENVLKYKVNDFKPLTNYSTAGTVSYSMGESFELSASISTSVGVTAEVVSAELGSSVTGSRQITASQSYTYDIPSGYKGRIIYRYSYDMYLFDCVTRWTLTGGIDRGEGSAISKPYNDASAYFTIQLVQA